MSETSQSPERLATNNKAAVNLHEIRAVIEQAFDAKLVAGYFEQHEDIEDVLTIISDTTLVAVGIVRLPPEIKGIQYVDKIATLPSARGHNFSRRLLEQVAERGPTMLRARYDTTDAINEHVRRVYSESTTIAIPYGQGTSAGTPQWIIYFVGFETDTASDYFQSLADWAGSQESTIIRA